MKPSNLVQCSICPAFSKDHKTSDKGCLPRLKAIRIHDLISKIIEMSALTRSSLLNIHEGEKQPVLGI